MAAASLRSAAAIVLNIVIKINQLSMALHVKLYLLPSRIVYDNTCS